MSISDNARERARIARLKALNSEEQVQNYGDATDSRVTVVNYDPDKSAYIVRTLNGELGYATNISGTQLGIGATVQATRKGNGFIIDYFKKDVSNTGSGDSLAKSAFGDSSNTNTFSPIFPGYDPNDSDIGYEPDGSGGCAAKAYAKGKRPEGVYATAKECQDSQKEGDFICVNGKIVETSKGQGKYKTRAEGEAALKDPGFTGGQCVGVQYKITVLISTFDSSCNPSNVSYEVFALGPIGPIENTMKPGSPYGWTEGASGGNPTCFANQVRSAVGSWKIYGNGGQTELVNYANGFWPFTASVQISRVDNQPDTCGNPPKVCPS